MRREKIVPVRLTNNEYEELLYLAEDAGNVSNFIRQKIFSDSKERNQYREILILIQQIRSDIGHALKLYQKDFLTDAAIELKNCSEQLKQLQKEMMKWP